VLFSTCRSKRKESPLCFGNGESRFGNGESRFGNGESRFGNGESHFGSEAIGFGDKDPTPTPRRGRYREANRIGAVYIFDR